MGVLLQRDAEADGTTQETPPTNSPWDFLLLRGLGHCLWGSPPGSTTINARLHTCLCFHSDETDGGVRRPLGSWRLHSEHPGTRVSSEGGQVVALHQGIAARVSTLKPRIVLSILFLAVAQCMAGRLSCAL